MDEHNTNEISEQTDQEVQGPLSGGSIVLRILGVFCIAVGIVDFITANTDLYDMYAGLPFVYQIGIGDFSLGFFTVIILCGVGSYLLRAGKNAMGVVTQDQKIMGIVAGAWLIILGATNANVIDDFSLDQNIALVKYGSLYDCPNRTLDDMANSFMNNPQWESVYSNDGRTYVNLTGGITVYNRPATALIQFNITANDTFELQAIEYNGVPQNMFESSHLLDSMCSTY
jgi:hypothetical protein